MSTATAGGSGECDQCGEEPCDGDHLVRCVSCDEDCCTTTCIPAGVPGAECFQCEQRNAEREDADRHIDMDDLIDEGDEWDDDWEGDPDDDD